MVAVVKLVYSGSGESEEVAEEAAADEAADEAAAASAAACTGSCTTLAMLVGLLRLSGEVEGGCAAAVEGGGLSLS